MYGLPNTILREPVGNAIESIGRERNEIVRSPSSDSWGRRSFDAYTSELDMMWPENSNTGGLGLVSSGSTKAHPSIRFRRSIIEECCERPCTVGQMLKYCGPRN